MPLKKNKKQTLAKIANESASALQNDTALDEPNMWSIGQSDRIHKISLDEIYTERQFREYFDPQEIGKLKQAIQANEFEGYILVKALTQQDIAELKEQALEEEERYSWTETHKYLLIYGESRYRAMEELGRKKIPAKVKPSSITMREVRRLRADENLVRNDFNPVEESNTIMAMMVDGLKESLREEETSANNVASLIDSERHAEERGTKLGDDVVPQLETLKKILRRYKGEEATLQGFLKIYRSLQNLPTDILDAIRKDLSYTKAIELKSIKDDATRERLLQEVIDGNLTIKEIRQRKKKLREQNKALQKGVQNNDATLPLGETWGKFVGKLVHSQTWQSIEDDATKKKEAQKLLQQLKDLLES